MSIFDSFTQKNSLSKTLRFELKPIGKTAENFKSNIFIHDQQRNDSYAPMKHLLDEAHMTLLEDALSSFEQKNKKSVDWQKLADAYITYRKEKSQNNEKKLEKTQEDFRKIIVNVLKEHENFSNLSKATPKEFIKNFTSDDKKELETVKRFKNFATYFKGYQENRKNIYSTQPQPTATAYRAINDNFPKYMECIKIFDNIKNNYPEILLEVEKELCEYLHGEELSDIFTISSYTQKLSQIQIDFFNSIIGGYTTSKNTKICGINEIINKYRQAHPENTDRNLSPMPKLYKQILSDKNNISFSMEGFKDDKQTLEAINSFTDELSSVLQKCKQLLSSIPFDSDKIYISTDSLSDISQAIYENYSSIKDAIQDYADTKFKKKLEQNKFKSQKEYSILDIIQSLKDNEDTKFIKFFETPTIKDPTDYKTDFWNYIEKSIVDYRETIKSLSTETKLNESKNTTTVIKNYLDAVQHLLHLMKPLRCNKNLDRDTIFYTKFDELYDTVEKIIPLYNMVRNYVTLKPNNKNKIRLMFDTPTLADGWDANKENTNLCAVLIKDNKYYLAITNKNGTKIDYEKLKQETSEDCYQKMVYKLISKPHMDLPRIIIKSESGKQNYHPSELLLSRYDQRHHIKSDPNFDLSFCHQLIDFFKYAINKNPDWKIFDFKFSDTKKYDGIDKFYNEVEEQAYHMHFINIPTKSIDTLVEKGDIFLFQIYNKDFSEQSNGRENLHTMYWRQIFSSINLDKKTIKLNGGAELFYRSAQIKEKNIYTHYKGEFVVNRCDKNGNSIPDNIHLELVEFKNNKRTQDHLSDEAKKYLQNMTDKQISHDITKDKRYTQDKFLFHVPISINPNVQNTFKANDDVNNLVKENLSQIKYIGIDRGERNLIYAVLINNKGEIEKQISFNKINKVDYHQKLDIKEKERDYARKNWKEIGKIKDLKEGYLSQVVHEISNLAIDNNAVIILEDLNFGFKRGRFCIEKQVYQKFEKALIDKLNYLVFKQRDILNVGGVLNGYQLTEKFESFEKLGKQTGIIYYVPAAYTSKIDPTTGFTNLFVNKDCKSEEKCKEFLEKFDAITYSFPDDAFIFKFNYDNFKTSQESYIKHWEVFSATKRLVYKKDKKTQEAMYPTQIIKNALNKIGISSVEDGYDLKKDIKNVDTKQHPYFCKEIFEAFNFTLQMRNSKSGSQEDYIASPVKNKDGQLFDSRECLNILPQDADANGAYHIALKGKMMLEKMVKENKDKPERIEHKDWFEYRQKQ